MALRKATFSCLLLLGCNVPAPRGSSGGVRLDAATPTTQGDGSVSGRCSRAVVVDESDYTSTNIALLDLEGQVLEQSVASSATRSVGLAAPLSGDIVLPTMPVGGAEIVLVDGFQSTSRIIWVDPATAGKRELSVATGFWSDPHDYAQLSSTKAYVSRYNPNPTPGAEPFDPGNDVLIIDPSKPAIVGSIDMLPPLGSDAARALPHVDKIVLAGDRAYVLLGALGKDFSAQVPSRIVSVDVRTDEVRAVVTLEGFLDCAGLALSPTGRQIAVLCLGAKIQPSAPSDLGGSGVVLIDIDQDPKMARSFRAADIGEGPVGFFGAYSSPSTLILQTFGYADPSSGKSADDTVIRLDLSSGQSEVVLRSEGEPFTLGGIACDVACGACFAADAKRQGGVVHRLEIRADGSLSGDQPIKVETSPGLPPRYLGRL